MAGFRTSVVGLPIEQMGDEEYYSSSDNRKVLLVYHPEDPETRKIYYRGVEPSGFTKRAVLDHQNIYLLPDGCSVKNFQAIYVDGILIDPSQYTLTLTTDGLYMVTFDKGWQPEIEDTVVIQYTKDGETVQEYVEPVVEYLIPDDCNMDNFIGVFLNRNGQMEYVDYQIVGNTIIFNEEVTSEDEVIIWYTEKYESEIEVNWIAIIAFMENIPVIRYPDVYEFIPPDYTDFNGYCDYVNPFENVYNFSDIYLDGITPVTHESSMTVFEEPFIRQNFWSSIYGEYNTAIFDTSLDFEWEFTQANSYMNFNNPYMVISNGNAVVFDFDNYIKMTEVNTGFEENPKTGMTFSPYYEGLESTFSFSPSFEFSFTQNNSASTYVTGNEIRFTNSVFFEAPPITEVSVGAMYIGDKVNILQVYTSNNPMD